MNDYEGQYYYDENNKDFQAYNPRLGFVKKVYGILSVQLLITALFVYLACKPFISFFQVGTCDGDVTSENCYPTDAAMTLMWICVALTLIIAIALSCYTKVARTVPTNYILLGLFTVCEAYLVGFVATAYSFQDVILAAILTAALTITLTVYACTTKTDFTMCGGLLWILGWGILAIGILAIFITWGDSQAYNIVTCVICVLAICVYGIYLIYDTQLIMGGHRYQLTLDDYIIGALALYIDIIVLFMRILQLLGAARSS